MNTITDSGILWLWNAYTVSFVLSSPWIILFPLPDQEDKFFKGSGHFNHMCILPAQQIQEKKGGY